MFSNNLVTLIVNSQMIAGRSKSIYSVSAENSVYIRNAEHFLRERERERGEKKREKESNL